MPDYNRRARVGIRTTTDAWITIVDGELLTGQNELLTGQNDDVVVLSVEDVDE